ncbi:MAG: amino acid permease [Deltaproteobacteria bacterium]|nr:amino acid permease [Deltaproteobacteria bacterium]
MGSKLDASRECPAESHSLKREIGLFTAGVLVVANMIGTGIFTTSGFIIQEVKEPLVLLVSWLVGGIFALCGALCYGELGAAFPEAGGEYVYLRESLGRLAAFLSGWISLWVGFSAPIAASAIAFATYGCGFLSVPVQPLFRVTIFPETVWTITPVELAAVAAILILSFVHYYGIKEGSRVQNALTGFKILIIILFITGGFIWGNGSRAHFSGDFSLASLFKKEFAVSLIFISFAYSGWNAATYLGSEIKSPRRNIPLALLLGTGTVLILYLLLNAVYIYALPVQRMSGVLEIGALSAASLFGPTSGRYFSGALAIGILSALSAMILTGPRVYYAMARDGSFFELFGRVNGKTCTPAFSIFLQAAMAILFIVTASFEKLLIYIGFTLALFALLTVLGLMRLRLKGSIRSASYRTFGYPVTPILFIAGNLWIAYISIRSRPTASLWGLVTIGAGLLAYFYFRKEKGKHAQSR